MNTSTFVWLLLAMQLVESESDVILKDENDGAKLDDLVAEYKAMDPPKDDLFDPAPSAAEKSRNLHDPISIRVLRGGPDHPHHYQLNTSSILIFDSVENFAEHVRSIDWLTNKRFRHPHLVYIPGVTISDIVEHINDGFLIDHVGFLVHDPDGSIRLATSFMFTKEKCRTNQLVTINRFSNAQVGWEDTSFYPQKYNNFHGCNLTLTASLGVDRLFVDIAKALNARLRLSINADLIGETLPFDGDESYITSDTIWTTEIIWVVPPGDAYSQFEKMFLPFDTETWIAICLTFLLAIITVQAVKFFPMKVQHFVFGRNFRHPTLNIFSLFLNGFQWRVPGRNFSRYILTLFTIWCLIFRTCYQSKMFEFLQADLRKPGPTSMEDMGYTAKDNLAGFNIKPGEDYYVPIVHGEQQTNRTKFKFCEYSTSGRFYDLKECLTIIADPANKAFTFTNHRQLTFFLNRIGSGNPSFAILDIKVRSAFATFIFKTFCPFYQTFNQKIGILLSSGIPQRNTENKIKIRGRGLTWKNEPMGPQVLTLEDLQIGFLIHLVCLSISTLVFFLELLPRWVKDFVKKVIMLNVVVAFFRNLYPGGTKLPPKRLVKVRRKPVNPKRKFIQVKPKSPSNSRVQIDIHVEVTPKAESLSLKLDVNESLPQCLTESVSDFPLVEFQAGSSTRGVGAEEFGSLETSIGDEFGPRPVVQTVTGRALPWWLLGDGSGGLIDVSDLALDHDWI